MHYKVIAVFQFRPQFYKLDKTYIPKPKNNGWLMSSIQMERGVRQCCPISALLFIIGVEILAIKIRTNNSINCVQVGHLCSSNNNNDEIKLIQ